MLLSSSYLQEIKRLPDSIGKRFQEAQRLAIKEHSKYTEKDIPLRIIFRYLPAMGTVFCDHGKIWKKCREKECGGCKHDKLRDTCLCKFFSFHLYYSLY